MVKVQNMTQSNIVLDTIVEGQRRAHFFKPREALELPDEVLKNPNFIRWQKEGKLHVIG